MPAAAAGGGRARRARRARRLLIKGPQRPGLVLAITQLLQSQDCDILDMETRTFINATA